MRGEVKEDFATRPVLRRVKAPPAVRSGPPILQARRSLGAVEEWGQSKGLRIMSYVHIGLYKTLRFPRLD